jgi:hypothetical protein
MLNVDNSSTGYFLFVAIFRIATILKTDFESRQGMCDGILV